MDRAWVCNLCGGTRPRALAAAGTTRFIACEGCGLHTVDPLPSPAALAREYDGFYAAQLVQNEFEDYVRLATASLRHQIPRIADAGGAIAEGARFLEVGFGGGHYLVAARIVGLIPTGVEVDGVAHARAQRLGLTDIHHGELFDVPFGPATFDLAKLMHVLEHVPDPRRLVREVHRVLKPGGWFVVDVPNQASAMARFKMRIRAFGLEREDYGYLQPPAHIYAFTSTTLQRLLAAEGFTVRGVVKTSPLDNLYFPTTPSYYGSSWRGRITRAAYRVLGRGSYLSVIAVKEGPDASSR